MASWQDDASVGWRIGWPGLIAAGLGLSAALVGPAVLPADLVGPGSGGLELLTVAGLALHATGALTRGHRAGRPRGRGGQAEPARTGLG